MSTRIILSASAIFMGAIGVAGLFMPHEILAALGVAPAGVAPLLMQLLAALLFAFAMVNWIARGSLIGGIYNRPVAIGNLTHFVIGALALIKGVTRGQHSYVLYALTATYALFAILFAAVFFRSPVQHGAGGAPDAH